MEGWIGRWMMDGWRGDDGEMKMMDGILDTGYGILPILLLRNRGGVVRCCVDYCIGTG